MQLVSINRGAAESIEHGKRQFVTGINKKACSGPVRVYASGLENDAVCDQEHHGGPDQALYVYGSDHYEWWSQELGQTVRPGTFGDNLTISDLPDDMNAGDRLLIGDLLLEATGPRIPCSTLAAQMQDSNFGLTFRRAEKPGYYFRVLNPGAIAEGDEVTLVPDPEASVSMIELFRLYYELSPGADQLRRVLDAPIAERLRARFEGKLAAISEA